MHLPENGLNKRPFAYRLSDWKVFQVRKTQRGKIFVVQLGSSSKEADVY